MYVRLQESLQWPPTLSQSGHNSEVLQHRTQLTFGALVPEPLSCCITTPQSEVRLQQLCDSKLTREDCVQASSASFHEIRSGLYLLTNGCEN
jgi:hypothetical protein